MLNTNQKNTAPKNHASTANTYGLGSASSYGHVKLSDSYTASGGAAANGVCASSKAVNEVYKKFNAENTTNSGQNIQSITSSADNYTDIKSIDISPGVYVAIARIDKFLNEQLRKQKNTYHKTYGNLSVSRVIELEGSDYAYRKLIFLTEDEMNCSELLKYLQTLLKNNSPKLLHGNPELKRLIRMYDLLRYK